MTNFKRQSARVLTCVSVLVTILSTNSSLAAYPGEDIRRVALARSVQHHRAEVLEEYDEGLAGVLRQNYEEEQQVVRVVTRRCNRFLDRIAQAIERLIDRIF